MPVPQISASREFGLATKWSASSMQTFKLPWPAPSPRTAAPSMYAFWLIQLVLDQGARDAAEQRYKDHDGIHVSRDRERLLI